MYLTIEAYTTDDVLMPCWKELDPSQRRKEGKIADELNLGIGYVF